MSRLDDNRRVSWSLGLSSVAPGHKVHLGRHNSEHVRSIREDFEPTEFAATLTGAGVTSVVLFAKDVPWI